MLETQPFSYRHGSLLQLALAALLVCLLPQVAQAASGRQAQLALQEGRIDDAVGQLQTRLAEDPHDAASQLLLCRAYFAEQLNDAAINACNKALPDAGSNAAMKSEIEDWLGRAYGRKADHAGPFSGFQLARKVRDAFEAAVNDNPQNAAAVNDLSEFYIGAPGIVGGGLDKAAALANRVASSLPQSEHRIRALIAEKQHDAGTAEREFRAAFAVANRPEACVDLGGFLKRQQRYDDATATFQRCIAIDHADGPASVDAASYLHDMHRDQPLAEQTLRAYLTGNDRSDDAPAVHVHVLLAQMLKEDGNTAGAESELHAAQALAANDPEVKRALQNR
jgi:tetratricopeptide (TPR) repeat protein